MFFIALWRQWYIKQRGAISWASCIQWVCDSISFLLEERYSAAVTDNNKIRSTMQKACLQHREEHSEEELQTQAWKSFLRIKTHMLIQSCFYKILQSPSRPHLTTGKKLYLSLHETHFFGAKRFGLVLLEATVNISPRFPTPNVWRRRTSVSVCGSFTETAVYSWLWPKYGKIYMLNLLEGWISGYKVMILESRRNSRDTRVSARRSSAFV